MKLTKIVILSIAACCASMEHLKAETIEEEFKKINANRNKRKALIDYLKEDGKIEESKEGTLIAKTKLRQKIHSMLLLENKARLRQFQIIAKIEGKSAQEIARAFAKKMGVNPSERGVDVLLRLHGSNTVGSSLAPELVKAFLKKQGYSNIALQKDGVEATISFNQPGKKNIGVVEIKAHGSSTAFKETNTSKKVGLLGGFADLGMASRQVKITEVNQLQSKRLGNIRSAGCEFPIALDGVAIIVNRENPVQQLTAQQIAKLFSGEIKNWKEVGGEDQSVRVFARDEQSGTWDTFKSKVLKPSKLKLLNSAQRFENSDLLVRNVANTKGAIGFCGLSYVDSTVTGVAVSSTKKLMAFQPTRLTVKTQNYPLSRLLYFYMPLQASTTARDFVKFTMSNEGQAVVNKVGLVGQGISTKKDQSLAEKYKKDLLSDSNVPKQYKELIQFADRRDSQANIRFAKGSNLPDTNSINNLERLASYLAENGNERVTVILAGFADSIGTSAKNRKLSEIRAKKVAQLLNTKGVTRIRVAGFGEAMPVADNKTAAGQAKNRRVEIWLER